MRWCEDKGCCNWSVAFPFSFPFPFPLSLIVIVRGWKRVGGRRPTSRHATPSELCFIPLPMRLGGRVRRQIDDLHRLYSWCRTRALGKWRSSVRTGRTCTRVVVVDDVMMVPVVVMLPYMMVGWYVRCSVLVLGMLVRVLAMRMVVLGMLVRMGLVCVHWMRLMRRLDSVLLQLVGMRVRMRMLVQMTVGGCRDNRLDLGSISFPVAFTSLNAFLFFSAPRVPDAPIHASSRLGTPSRISRSHVKAKLPFPLPLSHLSLALRRHFPITWGELSLPHFAIPLDQLPFSVPLELAFSLHETRGTLDSRSSRTDDRGTRRTSGSNHDTRSTYSRTQGISRRACSKRRRSLKYAHRRLRERWPVSICDAWPWYTPRSCHGGCCIL